MMRKGGRWEKRVPGAEPELPWVAHPFLGSRTTGAKGRFETEARRGRYPDANGFDCVRPPGNASPCHKKPRHFSRR